MLHLIEMLSVAPLKPSARRSQDGMKYRTLCTRCNSDLLGRRYDPALIQFSHEVGQLAESKLQLPATLRLNTRPNRLARSVVGHLLAFGLDQHRQGSANEALTDFFLDERLRFPSRLHLYYWMYPYNNQIVVRHAGLSLDGLNDVAPFMLLKFFPLAFFMVVDEPPSWRLRLRRLDTLLTDDIDDEVDLSIDLTALPAAQWPEAPGQRGVALYGDDAAGAIPQKKASVCTSQRIDSRSRPS